MLPKVFVSVAGGAEHQERWDCACLRPSASKVHSTICPNEETGVSEGTVATEISNFVLFSIVNTCQTLWSRVLHFAKIAFFPKNHSLAS